MPYQSSFYSNNQLYVPFQWLGIYSASAQYTINQAVYFNGGSYICISQPPVGTDPTNATYWQVMAAPGTATPGGSPGQVQYNDAGTSVGGFDVSGDGTLNTSTGALTVTKTNGTAFAPSATVDTTDAGNITSGILPNAQVPMPTLTALGGVEAVAAVASQWINSISTTGVPALSQPSFSDIAGSAATAQLPADVLYSDIAGQVISGGANVTSYAIATGNVSTDPSLCPLQYVSNNAAFTIAAPSKDGNCLILVTNTATAGAVTFTGFSVGPNTGDAIDAINGHLFTVSVWRINGISGYRVAAHQ